MNIKDFYNYIQQHSIPNYLIIFKYSENKFLTNQYINEICKQHKLQKVFINDLVNLQTESTIFNKDYLKTILQVYDTDKFECTDLTLLNSNNIIITCNTIEENTEQLFKDYIITIPKLEKWQIKDYVYSQLPDISTDLLDWLINICNFDILRLDIEIDRLKLFPSEKRNFYIQQFSNDYIYEDLTNYTIFNFINALIIKDTFSIYRIYNELINLDFSPLNIVGLLYNNFKNIIIVQLTKNSSPEICGIKENQYYAIKRNMGHYNENQLIKIFSFITDIYKQLKLGQISTEYLLDYLLITILTF